MEKFHDNVGSNIVLTNDNKTVEKKAKREMKNSIVFSKRSLRDNVIYTIKIEDTKFQEASDVSVGLIYCDPARLSFGRECMTHQLQDGVWLLHGKGLYMDGERRADYVTHIKVSTGDTLGVMRTTPGAIHFYKNGVDQGKAECFSKVPRDVWALVGLEWGITKVSTQPSGINKATATPLGISKVTSQPSPLDSPKSMRPVASYPSITKTRVVEKTPLFIKDKARPYSPSAAKPRDVENISPYKGTPVSVPKADEAARPTTPSGVPHTTRLRPMPTSSSLSPALTRRAALVHSDTMGLKSCRSEPNLSAMLECPYRKKCLIVKEKMRLHDAFFDPSHDVCFCRKCYLGRGDNTYYTRGEPPRRYGLPIGWYKFGLRTPAKAESLDVFKMWHVAFHGTKPTTVNSILNTGDLLMPGDVTIEGEEVRPPSNHYDDQATEAHMKPPSGHDIKKIYLSPSIKYAGCEAYAPAFILTDPSTLDQFDARVALQVRIMPGSYDVGRETIGAGYKRVDDMFSNLDLEWATRRRGAIVLVGFLVKVEGYEDIPGAATTELMRLGPRLTQA